jgi:hypothetical protein
MPKVSGRVRRYSRFAETIGGDKFDHDCRPILAVDLAKSYCVGIAPDECGPFGR